MASIPAPVKCIGSNADDSPVDETPITSQTASLGTVFLVLVLCEMLMVLTVNVLRADGVVGIFLYFVPVFPFLRLLGESEPIKSDARVGDTPSRRSLGRPTAHDG
jgi:hypothetical protein